MGNGTRRVGGKSCAQFLVKAAKIQSGRKSGRKKKIGKDKEKEKD